MTIFQIAVNLRGNKWFKFVTVLGFFWWTHRQQKDVFFLNVFFQSCIHLADTNPPVENELLYVNCLIILAHNDENFYFIMIDFSSGKMCKQIPNVTLPVLIGRFI